MTDAGDTFDYGRSNRGMPSAKRGRRNVRREVGGFEREKDDFYPTPAALTRPMLRLERFDGGVWECACGNGAMVDVLTEFGHPIVATDLVERGPYKPGGRDFLMEPRLLAPNIVTNPPFKLWREFAQHAVALGAQKIVLLGRLLNLEGIANSTMMRGTGLTRVLISAGRVNMAPPGAMKKGHGTVIAYAWFVWERGHVGPPSVHWFSPDRT